MWPDGHQSCVALSFDLDGPTGAAMIDGSIWRNAALFTHGSYGPWRSLGYLLGLLDELAIPTTFFIPGWVIETWPDRCRAIVERGHDVAYHGYKHEAFWQLSTEQQQAVMELSRKAFHRHLGVTPTGFRTPSGDWGAETVRVLLDAGVSYSSSMRGDDRPYFIGSGAPGDDRALVEIPARWEMDDYTSLAYQRKPDYPAGLDRIASYDTTLDNWCREFDGAHRDGLCLTTLFHPKVSGKPGRVLLMEKFLAHMKATPKVWFATCSEVDRWWRRRQPEDAA